ncbi:N5-glutamine S-adenosyl-L-methionine-dependent methyltransferase [Planctomycetes bacterium Poly30]|uniref:N5-glutamine S-adenosyl-L-methionine-dependent methyltransferase n=1 Tax=Saltatorellus ferox TaxID=2528018 RepID=A0A518ETN9_9BACT|nr:N5-glutamine S-adenosyl-L-methionine-dependent methyltransferase [Planctomycetes bacterium Poly30]
MSVTLPVTTSSKSVPDRAQLAALGPHSPRGPLVGPSELRSVFEAFGLNPLEVLELGTSPDAGDRFHVVAPQEILVGRRFASLDAELDDDSAFLLVLEGKVDDRRLATWRNSLWPMIHVGAILRCQGGRARRITLGGTEEVEGTFDFDGAVLFGRRTAHVMAPEATVEKFDKNASGWDGQPGGPGYPHFRWMRRFVGHFVQPLPAPKNGGPLRVLDFGCGAGWVGIEVAKAVGDVYLASFDPSPEMVKITGKNAEKEGVQRFEGRVGFGEAPPFGGVHEGATNERFDYVVSSGVVSFSPDVEAWMDGLVATLAPGADLVVGDIHPLSKGFLRRRMRKPLLPVREMNARTREAIRAGLEARGLKHVRSGAYQITRPIPELMHLNETKLKGLLTYPLLWMNKLMTALDGSFGSPMQDRFDSWVMHLQAPGSEE